MEQMESYRALAEEALHHCLPDGAGYSRTLFDAARYSLLAGGKRLRPCLVLAAAERAGAALEEALPYACAMEMIHTYSLIHDDLPAMDNDTLRRGRPTSHVVYGEAMAILAGDCLLTHAFVHMAGAARRHPERAQAHLRAAGRVAEAAEAMAAGQAVDVLCEKQGAQAGREADQLKFIHENKTAAMIRGALLAGAELGDADDALLAALSLYGNRLGVAFQVADDILDACSTSQQMGKTVGKDAAAGKLTYVSLFGVEKSKARLEALTEEAIASVAPVDRDGFFASLARELLTRKQ